MSILKAGKYIVADPNRLLDYHRYDDIVHGSYGKKSFGQTVEVEGLEFVLYKNIKYKTLYVEDNSESNIVSDNGLVIILPVSLCINDTCLKNGILFESDVDFECSMQGGDLVVGNLVFKAN